MFVLFSLLLVQTLSVHSAEQCQNYPTTIRPNQFEEGDWIDQLRIFSGNNDYVSQFAPNETVSMFRALYETICGFWELKTQSKAGAIELSKRYYAPRFHEHFYPLQVTIKRDSNELKCNFFLEQLLCEYYDNLTTVVEGVNILLTDYSSFLVIHQCIDKNRNYLMLLTKKKELLVREKNKFEKDLIGIMREFKIVIENQTFWWPTTDECDKHVGSIFPTFYRKIYIDRQQSNCSKELTVKLADLKDLWKIKIDLEDAAWEDLKAILKCVAVMIVGTVVIVGGFAIFLDNFEP